jgi:hypothetical protein
MIHPLAAQIQQLADKWRQRAIDMREEAWRIRRTIKQATGAEERCNVRAEILDKCGDELALLVGSGTLAAQIQRQIRDKATQTWRGFPECTRLAMPSFLAVGTIEAAMEWAYQLALVGSGTPTPEPKRGCLKCGNTLLVGYTMELQVGPFCRECWEALKMHVAQVNLLNQKADRAEVEADPPSAPNAPEEPKPEAVRSASPQLEWSEEDGEMVVLLTGFPNIHFCASAPTREEALHLLGDQLMSVFADTCEGCQSKTESPR